MDDKWKAEADKADRDAALRFAADNGLPVINPKLLADSRIPYGTRCTWWDSIDKVALSSPSQSGHRIPICPGCGCPLFEVENETVWFEGARRYEQNGHPGYVDMLTWARGKCFPNAPIMAAAYRAAGSPKFGQPIEHIDTPKPLSRRRARRLRGRR